MPATRKTRVINQQYQASSTPKLDVRTGRSAREIASSHTSPDLKTLLQPTLLMLAKPAMAAMYGIAVKPFCRWTNFSANYTQGYDAHDRQKCDWSSRDVAVVGLVVHEQRRVDVRGELIFAKSASDSREISAVRHVSRKVQDAEDEKEDDELKEEPMISE